MSGMEILQTVDKDWLYMHVCYKLPPV